MYICVYISIYMYTNVHVYIYIISPSGYVPIPLACDALHLKFQLWPVQAATGGVVANPPVLEASSNADTDT